MRHTPLASVVVIGLIVPAAARAQAASSAFRAEVETAVRAFVAAYNRGDAGAVAASYSTQPGVTVIGDGEIVRGWDRIREGVGAMDSLRAQGPVTLTLGSLDVSALGERYALAVAPFTFTLGKPGAVVTHRGAVTLVLNKVGKDWKIIHDHTSWVLPPPVPTTPAAATAAAPPAAGGQVGAAPPAAAPRTGKTIPIAAGTLPEIPPQQVVHYDFQIPAAVCTVTGRVEGISGGSRDFELLVLDDANYQNWTAGRQAGAFATSGRVTSYGINAAIPGPGTYHLVISNAFQVGVAKTVQVWAQVQCP